MKRLSTGYRHAGEGPGRGDRRELEHRQVRRGVPLPVTVFWDNFCHNRGSDAGSDADGERNSRPMVSGLEKGW